MTGRLDPDVGAPRVVAREPEHVRVVRHCPGRAVLPPQRLHLRAEVDGARQERLRLAVASVTLREQRRGGVQIVLDEAADHGLGR